MFNADTTAHCSRIPEYRGKTVLERAKSQRVCHMARVNEIHAELGQSARHDGGAYPSIGLSNNNTVVQVNNSAGLLNELWCHAGNVEAGGDISWGEPVWYGDGLYPRVAINNHGIVVEVHEAQLFRDLYYLVGVVDTARKVIQWGDCHHYDSGLAPAVALLDNGTVISVHQTSFLGSYTTYYRVGTVDIEHKKITWGNSVSYGRGRELALAANKDTVVEVHRRTWGQDLHYRVGKLDGSEIKWGEGKYYDKGSNPSISINCRGHVLEVHTSIALRRLYCNIGVVDTRIQTIGWVRDSREYAMGKYPSVCLNDNDDKSIVEVHETNLGTSIWCCTGTLKPSN